MNGESVKATLKNLVVKEGEVVKKLFQHKTLEERALEFDGKLMLDGEYDWGKLVGREICKEVPDLDSYFD